MREEIYRYTSKEGEKVESIFVSQMIAFEETTPEEEKAEKRPKFILKHFRQALKDHKKEVEEEILRLLPKERRVVHTVIARGSQEDLNDTFRKGYNKCRNDFLQALNK